MSIQLNAGSAESKLKLDSIDVVCEDSQVLTALKVRCCIKYGSTDKEGLKIEDGISLLGKDLMGRCLQAQAKGRIPYS